jgi:hypothetical protein
VVVDLTQVVGEVREQVQQQLACAQSVIGHSVGELAGEGGVIEQGERCAHVGGGGFHHRDQLRARQIRAPELGGAVTQVAPAAQPGPDEVPDVARQVVGQRARGVRHAVGARPDACVIRVCLELAAEGAQLTDQESGESFGGLHGQLGVWEVGCGSEARTLTSCACMGQPRR